MAVFYPAQGLRVPPTSGQRPVDKLDEWMEPVACGNLPPMQAAARWCVPILVAGVALGCAYPRRSTSLAPASGAADESSPPGFVWALEVVSGVVPPRKRGGATWDEDGGLPDPFVRLYRDESLVFETAIVEDQLEPEWTATPERNVVLPPDVDLRFEMWDSDRGVNSDPIGIWRGRGLPSTALPGADARITLEGGAQLLVRVHRAKAHRGVGIQLYEVRSDRLIVLEVIEHSPAGRAGIQPGDLVVAIGGDTVEDLGEARAASALSLAVDRSLRLTVEHPNGQRDQIELDRGLVWLTM